MKHWRRTLVILIFAWEIVDAVSTISRPENILLDLLARPFAPTEGASNECIRDSKIYFAELRKYNPWALQMYDASAKIPPGVISGNIQQLGNYDECLQIKTDQNFIAQACSASVQFEILKGPRRSLELDMKDLLLQVAKAANLKNVPDNSVDYEWTWCVPSTCNHSEISEALELALDPLKIDGRLDFAVSVNANSCHTVVTDNNKFDIVDWSYIGVLLTFLTIIISSTTYDLYAKRKAEESKCKDVKHSYLISFSLYSNGKNLLSTERSRDMIGCLDGLRYISICWIVYGHTFYTEAVGVKMDRSRIPKLHEDWSSLLVLNGNIITDTFFLLSGILLAYTSLAKSTKEANSSVNVFNLYLNRYFRLTPAYAIVIGFYSTLFEKLGSGPRWNIWIHSNKLDCRANWWTNLLYINNYVNISNICMSQSWYLSVDMQLLWISPIFLYPMLKSNKGALFWIIAITGIILSVLIPFFVTFFLKLTGTMLYYKSMQDVTNVYLQIYTRVYARAGPYIIGLSFGYLLFKTKHYKIRISTIYIICGWLIAITAGISAILGPRGMYFNNHPYNKWEASFYAGLHRHIFTLSVSWIIFVCVNGYAGPLNAFLCWRAWIPLSKLTYSAYLSHYIVLLYNIGSVRTPGRLSTFSALHAFFGNLCLTMFLSLSLSCCFEMPFMILTRLILTPGRSKDKTELIFGSTNSGEGICRSSEDINNSSTSSVNSVYAISKNSCSVYDLDIQTATAGKIIESRDNLNDCGSFTPTRPYYLL
ncbi:PREDICTED: nose resistant to fluoxetine protein 6-like [Ceratosolen solmsi marchali]|uniref:Nose resistant to fluoxetine protein 6-like n=1 Tax=Ceratosolen solmsi marchali TaxID=326594 RepID=A0AAJ7DVZ0_9HYME|nr:PREDICTED: nose resistant to fluoxetine protein 6-like [Ceratosolen solmsi marchali]